MDLTFSKDGTVKIEMKKMLEDTISLVDDQLDVNVSSPSNKIVYEISEDVDQLDTKSRSYSTT